MIILKDTDSLQVLLGGTVAANQAVLYAAFVDVDAATFDAVAAGNGNGLTNSTTAVSWVASPVSGQFRQAKYLSLYNADTASVTATVRINDGTNTRIDVSEKTTETAATAAVLSTTAIAADDELTFDIVAAGTGATGAKITLVATAP
jgi:hypothetical protein